MYRYNVLKMMGLIIGFVCVTSIFALPIGSYQQSCQACVMQGGTLTCNCPTKSQQMETTSLVGAWNCKEILNDNGKLICFSRTHDVLPEGNYQQSCRDCKIIGDDLSCLCLTRRHLLNHSVVYHFKNCKSKIRNINGNLMCQMHSWGLPPGSYQRSCWNCFFFGYKLHCSCIRADGALRYTTLLGANVCINIRNINGYLRCW